MSKLIDELEMTITHNRFPRKMKMGIVNIEVSAEQSYTQEINDEILIESRFFVVAKSMKRDRNNALLNAADAIRHAIYQDVIELGHKIVDATHEGDCQKVSSLTMELMRELTGRNYK